MKRLFDISLAGILLCLLSPLLLIFGITYSLRGQRLHRAQRLGRYGIVFEEYAFSTPEPTNNTATLHGLCNRLPVLGNILKGDMSFIGPRPLSPEHVAFHDPLVQQRCLVRPGLIGLWWLRQRIHIAYEPELIMDCEYVTAHSLRQDFGIALRALPALMLKPSTAPPARTLSILGLPIANMTMTEAVDALMNHLDGDTPSQICFINADCANIAYRHRAYREVCRSAQLTLADGIGLQLAGAILGRPIKENVNGTDMLPRLCAALARTDHGVFLLGARPGVAESVRDWIATHYPTVRVVGWQHGYYPPYEEPAVLQRIAASGASILLVALGTPHQELWIHQHLHATGVKIAMGVGGLFDFYAGRLPRAPQWVRELGGEWFYRFLQEPQRLWKRYWIGNVVFVSRVLREKWHPTLPFPIETHNDAPHNTGYGRKEQLKLSNKR